MKLIDIKEHILNDNNITNINYNCDDNIITLDINSNGNKIILECKDINIKDIINKKQIIKNAINESLIIDFFEKSFNNITNKTLIKIKRLNDNIIQLVIKNSLDTIKFYIKVKGFIELSKNKYFMENNNFYVFMQIDNYNSWKYKDLFNKIFNKYDSIYSMIPLAKILDNNININEVMEIEL